MKKFVALAPVLMLCACMSAQDHREAVSDNSSDRISVGTVQREIRVGMSSSDVVEALGSPNMVTTDDKRRETWVYDKVSTESVVSSSSGGVNAMILGGFSNILLGGGASGNVNRSAGASSSSQKTLTIIIKFDENHKVRDFSYRQTSF